jgi:predicted ArsR family transcriptional regulator
LATPRPVHIGSPPVPGAAKAAEVASVSPQIDPPGQHFSAAVTAATSMFGDGTRRKIYLFARSATGGITVSEAAAECDVHPNVARHHLDKLAAGGYLDVTLATSSGRTGRPSKRYRSNGRPIDLEFPARKHDLMATLLGRALELLPDDVARAMAEEVGEHYGRELAEQMQPGDGHRSMQSALHAVADALTAHGFAAHTEERADGMAIVSGQCPFGELSAQHPVICAVDRGIVRGMLSALHGDGGDPEQSASRSAGDSECVTTV